MARSLGPRWNGYVDGIAVRSGTSDIFNKKKAAGIQVDSGASYALKYNSNGTVRTLVDLSLTQTLTNKTLTSPTINGAALSATTTLAGAGAGVATLQYANSATSRTITIPDPGAADTLVALAAAQTISNKTFDGTNIQQSVKVLAASATFTSNATLANLTGFSFSLAAGGTYYFRIVLPVTMTINGGISVAFNYTTLTLTSIQVRTYAATASDNTTAVSSQSTTTTTQTKFVDTKVAAYTLAVLEGTLVVNAAGTLAVQAAQNTSHVDTTTVLLGASAQFVRVA